MCYKPNRAFGRSNLEPKKVIYTLMSWKKTKKNRHWNYKGKRVNLQARQILNTIFK